MLQLGLCNKRLKSLLEIGNSQWLALPLHIHITNLLGWDQDAADDLNDAVFGDTVFNRDAGKTIDRDADEATIAGDVNTEGAIFE